MWEIVSPKLSTVAPTCDPRIQEVEAGRSGDHPWLCEEFKSSLDNKKYCLIGPEGVVCLLTVLRVAGSPMLCHWLPVDLGQACPQVVLQSFQRN